MRMSRLNAALLAGVISTLLFAGVIVLVNRLLVLAVHLPPIPPRFVVFGIVGFNGLAIPMWAVFMSRGAKKEEDYVRPTPLHRWQHPIGRREP